MWLLVRVALALIILIAIVAAGALGANLWLSVALASAAFAAVWFMKGAERLRFIARELKARGVRMPVLAAIGVAVAFLFYFAAPLALYGVGWLVGGAVRSFA